MDHRKKSRAEITRATSLAVALAVASASLGAGGCASEYTIVDRSRIRISENARITATNVLPGGDKNARAAQHLALAQEVYQRQLDLLKERRNKVRGRRRTLQILSYGLLALSAVAAGWTVLASESPGVRRAASGGAIAGATVGTGLQIGALMQEEVGAVDDKIRHLQGIYDAMVERVRVLAAQAPTEQSDAAIGMAIESFINEALQINVKG
jgi:hypothetical protein